MAENGMAARCDSQVLRSEMKVAHSLWPRRNYRLQWTIPEIRVRLIRETDHHSGPSRSRAEEV